MDRNKNVSFIGTGNMGKALICAAAKILDPQRIYITDHDMSKAAAIAQEIGCNTINTNEEAASIADYIFICIKPQNVGDVLSQISPILERTKDSYSKTLVSIAKLYPGKWTPLV